MLEHTRMQQLNEPWPDIIETALGAVFLWMSVAAGYLLGSGAGTIWLLAGTEVIALAALLALRVLRQDATQWRIMLTGGLLFGTSCAGLSAAESGLSFWATLASLVAAGFVLRSVWAALMYPLPVFLAFIAASVDLMGYVGVVIGAVMLLVGALSLMILVGIGVFIRHRPGMI